MIKKVFLFAVALGLVIGGSGLLWLATLDIPDFGSFDERLIAQSTKIYDRTGKILLYNVQDEVRRHIVSSENISRHIKNATVAIEDDQFYEHRGIKPMAILRAVFVNLGAGTLKQGGSTITQQLIKNTLLTQEKKFSRKIKEAVLAVKLEKVMNKEQILNLYLNETPYGGNIYGVEEAAQAFFGKSAKEVSLAEAAYIASVPKAPTFYSPYGQNKEKLKERQSLVLTRMRELGFITKEEEQAAQTEIVTFLPPQNRGIKAPHFSLWVRDYLEEKYGSEVVRSRGLKVTTTLNWEWQKQAEEVVDKIAPGNEANFRAKNTGLVAIDPKTGEILVMVGSRDYFEVSNDGNFNTTLAHRQPGSAFKPFVYATAFNKGYTPETVLFDLETQFDVNCGDGGNCYKPQNYDSLFRGPINLRNALAQSINIPAIKVLYLAGINDSLKTAREMGIKSLGNDPNLYGLTLVLGGGEVSLLELTSAYGVFANDGLRSPYFNILKVEDAEGKILEEASPRTTRVLPENTARLISDILSDNQARTPLFGENNLLTFGDREVAAKTGTTNDYRDAWIVGYTPNVVIGAWAGNNDNTPMEKRVAGMIIAPLWHEVMAKILPDLNAESFTDPLPTFTDLKPALRGYWQGGESYFIDKISGKLATAYTP
ncbi:MAG: PBP1A family penicillin-binding protein, partial [Patescibacteria group bacterium]